MMTEQISHDALVEVKSALRRYRMAIGKTQLADTSKDTYLLHATNFVRWLEGDFEPGSNL